MKKDELSMERVMQLTGLGKDRIQQLIKRGDLTAVHHIRYGKGGGRYRTITADSVSEYLNKVLSEEV